MAKDGVTVLVTSHYMDEAELCQRIGFITRGRLAALDTPDRLKETQMRGQVLEISASDPERGQVGRSSQPGCDLRSGSCLERCLRSGAARQCGWTRKDTGSVSALLLNLHVGTTLLITITVVVAFVKLVRGISQKQLYDTSIQRIMLAFSGLITVQWLLGIALLIALGNYSRASFWTHAGTMTVATGASYAHSRWRNARDSVRYRTSLLVLIGVVVLVAIGIVLVDSGRQRTP